MDGDHPPRPGQQERKYAGGVVHQVQLLLAGQPGDFELAQRQQSGQQPGPGQTHGLPAVAGPASPQQDRISPYLAQSLMQLRGIASDAAGGAVQCVGNQTDLYRGISLLLHVVIQAKPISRLWLAAIPR